MFTRSIFEYFRIGPLGIMTLDQLRFADHHGIGMITGCDSRYAHRQTVCTGRIGFRSSSTDNRHLIVTIYDVIATETKRIVR